MPTNLGIDDRLLEHAHRVSGRRSKKETVNEALREYVARRRRLKAVESFGTIAFDPDYDYKARRRKR